MNQLNDWIVFIRVKFHTVIDAMEQQFTPVSDAQIWRFGPENVELDELGLPIFKAASWGGFALFKDLETAQHLADNPAELLSDTPEIVEIWSALLQPIRHRGEVDWRGEVESSSAIHTSTSEQQGPLAVITSAGFVSQEPEELPRIKQFTTGSQQILRDFEGNSELLAGAIFYSMFDGFDGITVTLWPDVESMQNAAYETGLHSEKFKQHRQTPMADRISNTRATVVRSQGSWNGADPAT